MSLQEPKIPEFFPINSFRAKQNLGLAVKTWILDDETSSFQSSFLNKKLHLPSPGRDNKWFFEAFS